MKVYRITNNVNGKLYFGITKCSLEKRWAEHKHNSLRSKKKTHLYLAIQKYGLENFSIELVKDCKSDEEMYSLEIHLIKQFKTTDKEFGYNNSTGGEASSKGKKLSNETKLKISGFQKGRKRNPHSPETIHKLKLKAVGRTLSKEAIEKSASIRRGKPSFNVKPVILNGAIEFSSITEAAKFYGCSHTTISNNLSGLSKTTKQGIWHFKTN